MSDFEFILNKVYYEYLALFGYPPPGMVPMQTNISNASQQNLLNAGYRQPIGSDAVDAAERILREKL